MFKHKICIFNSIKFTLTLFFAISVNSQLAQADKFQIKDTSVAIVGDCKSIEAQANSLLNFKNLWQVTDSSALKVVMKQKSNSCRADITQLIPDQMWQLHKKHWLNGVGGYGNCHGSALYFAQMTPFLGHNEQMDLKFSKCERVPFAQVQAGDMGLIFHDEEFVAHSFTVLTKDIIFSKNGHNGTGNPYQVSSIEEVADVYFVKHADDSEEPIKNPDHYDVNLYREDLKKGIDCLRGTPKQIEKCSDELSHPYAIYMRCSSTQELEHKTPEVVKSKLYQQSKNAFLNIQKQVVENSQILKEGSSKIKNQLVKIGKNMTAEMENLKPYSDEEFVWMNLSSSIHDLLLMIDPENELHQSIFNKPKTEK